MLAVAASLAAQASEGRATEAEVAPRLVIDIAGTSDATVVMERLRAAFGEGYEAEVVPLEQALDRGFGPWSVPMPATFAVCDAAPVSYEALDAALGEAEAHMQMLEYAEARQALDALETSLCAATEPVSPDLLARVPYLQGIVHYYEGDRDAAQASFRRAVERQPELSWDPDFPPDPQQVFLDGVADAYRTRGATLVLAGGERPDRLLLDGVEVAADEVELVGADHLVQFSIDGGWATTVLATGEAESVRLMGAEAIRAGLASGPDDPAGAPAFDALQSAATDRGHSELLIALEPEPTEVWRFNTIGRSWERVSLVLGHQLSRGRRTQQAGVALLGAGAAIGIVGAAIGFSSHARGSALTEDMLSDPGLYDHHLPDYQAHQRGTTTGFTVLAVGGGLVAAGIPLLIRGGQMQRGAVQEGAPTARFTPDPRGFGLALEF